MSLDTTAWPSRRFHMPAEWAPHEATWLSWPHNKDTWPDCFDLVEPTMVEVVRLITETEHVHINVLDADHAAHVADLLDAIVPPEQVSLHHCPTNDAWIRDHGAIFVLDEDRRNRMALDFEYNAWGGKYPPFDLDRQVARFMADTLGAHRFAPGLVLEGGSIDVNGAGALLTTEQCLLNANRNPALTRLDIEAALRATLGVEEIIWLGGGIEGDDTDGHVDDHTRFVARDKVVTVVEPNRDDPNHAPLAANRAALQSVELEGRPLEVVELPMPAPQLDAGRRLPASYANFYVANGLVLVPVFVCEADRPALELLAECFPERRILAIDARGLVAGLGALHCLTQQVPRLEP